MYLLLDTSTPTCKLSLVIDGQQFDDEWLAERGLAKGLLQYITSTLAQRNATIADIDGIGYMRGPGSFTGLRIGAAVLNTLAEFESIAIVGTTGANWQQDAIQKLQSGENERMILPEYGRDARITAPRK